MPSRVGIWCSDKLDCSTRRMISNFSEAEYLIYRHTVVPISDHAFFKQAVFY